MSPKGKLFDLVYIGRVELLEVGSRMKHLLSLSLALVALVAQARAVPGDLAVFFGSFDPLNEGHLAACLGARPDLGVETILVIPNPDKNAEKTEASFEDRLAMVRAMAYRYPEIESPDPEIVKVLKNAGPHWKKEVFGLLYQSLPLGAVVQEIVGMSHFHRALAEGTVPGPKEPRMLVVVDRPGYPLDVEKMTQKKIAPGKVLFLHPEVIDVDSARLRESIRKGEDIFGKVPAVIRKLIEQRNLYR